MKNLLIIMTLLLSYNVYSFDNLFGGRGNRGYQHARAVNNIEDFTPLSVRQAEQLWDYTSESTEPQDFFGKWEKFMSVDLLMSDHDIAGLQSEKSLKNGSGLIHEIEVTSTLNPLLPEGENIQYFITEKNIVGEMETKHVIDMIGPSFKYTRNRYIQDSHSSWFSEEEQFSYENYMDNFRKLNLVNQVVAKSTSRNVKCSLLANNFNIMLCRLGGKYGKHLYGFRKIN